MFDDLMNIIRQRNLFQTPPISPMNANAISDPTNTGVDTSGDSRLKSVYGDLSNAKTGPANAAYRDFLAKGAPNEDDYKPTKMSRLGAILAGLGPAITEGGSKGLAVTKGLLDEPYNKALYDYKQQGDRLAKGADLEEKDINNRVKTYRDILEDQDKQQTNARQGKLVDAQVNNYNSQVENRAGSGFSQYNAPATGHRMATKIGAGGKPMTIDLGAVDLTPTEKDTNAVKRATDTAKAVSPITASREKDVAATNASRNLDNEKAMADYRASIAFTKEQRTAAERSARDSNDPNRSFSARALAYRDVLDAHPDQKGNIDLQTLTHKPEAEALVKEALKKYEPKQALGAPSNNGKKTEADATAYLKSKGKVATPESIKLALEHQGEW